MDGAQVGVFEEGDQVGLDRFLKRTNGRGLETEIRLEVLRNFANKTLEGKLADQELGRLLVATNLTQSDSTGLVAMRLLDTTGRRRGLAGGLGRKLLTGDLATGRLAWVKLARKKDEQSGTYELSAWCEPW